MTDIITTSPKHLMREMEEEAEDAKREIAEFGKSYYYRNTSKIPHKLNVGDRIWYVEDGYVRGFAIVVQLIQPGTAEDGGRGLGYIVSDASTWTWIKPIPMKGFQGWRYFHDPRAEIVGGYLDPRPEV